MRPEIANQVVACEASVRATRSDGSLRTPVNPVHQPEVPLGTRDNVYWG
jgi:hypothetical protein